MARLFGTDGIRGIANEYPINSEMGIVFGRALVKFCNKKALIITGRDTRISGPMLESAVISGILSWGGDVLSAEIIPTPGLAYLVKRFDADAGVMISASHNPFEYNGFKPFYKGGEKLSEDQEDHLETLIIRPSKEKTDIGNLRPFPNAILYYKDFLINTGLKDISFKDIKVVVDCANGATYKVAPMVFEELGVNATILFSEPNGKNINNKCGSQYPEILRAKVLETGANLGIAFDGDGDRLIAVDEKGDILTGDHLIAIFSKMLKHLGIMKNPVVVTTVMSNIGLKLALEKMGIKHVSTKVGDRNVVKEMKNRGAILGGEESGHIIFLNHHSTGDGIISAIQLLCAIKLFNKSLNELAHIMKSYPQIMLNVEVKQKPELSSIPEINSEIKKIEKELFPKGRILVRYSGTEPVCRIMVEGEDKDKIKNYANQIAFLIKKRLG